MEEWGVVGGSEGGEVMPAPPDGATPFFFFPKQHSPLCRKRSLSPSQRVSLTQLDVYSRSDRRFRGARQGIGGYEPGFHPYFRTIFSVHCERGILLAFPYVGK